MSFSTADASHSAKSSQIKRETNKQTKMQQKVIQIENIDDSI